MLRNALFSFLVTLGWLSPAAFEPSHRLTALGVARNEMTDELLARRSLLMIEAQTFAILRDPRAAAGAARVLSPKMQSIFETASQRSGLPASLITAIAFLESWGDSNAQSPTGPKGVMQISGGTARAMGLKVVYSTKYRVTAQKRRVKTKSGKYVTKTVRVRTPYSVVSRDERLVPEKAIPAAAVYLARLQQKFGGIDWAVFAYHCGEGCVGSMRELTEQAKGIDPPFTVAKMFFSATPARNRELYDAVRREMERDYSPTYYFRIMRAQQLLEMYKENPGEFKRLAEEYRFEPNPAQRAPHRLAVWLRSKDLLYVNDFDIETDQQNLVPVFDDAEIFGFRLSREDAPTPRATRAAVGTLVYLSYETRRLFDAMKTKDKWAPLEVTELVLPSSRVETKALETISHGTGQVFDIDYRNLPLSQREALEFVLQDMGWSGYVGFVEETPKSGTMHIGCAPSARDFFTKIYDEALAKVRRSS